MTTPLRLRDARRAQRRLESARAQQRFIRLCATGVAAIIAAITCGWVTLINFGADGYERGINRSGPIAGFVTMLILVSIGAIVLVGFVVASMWDASATVRDREADYEDALDVAAGADQ